MDIKALLATISSYLVSFGLLLGDVMNWFGANYQPIAAITAIITCAGSLYYQHKNSENLLRGNRKRR